MQVKDRINLERKICRAVIKDALKDGFKISVYDGEAFAIKRSDNFRAICAALMSTDEDVLQLYKADKKEGWIHFIYGNTGWDVVHDYTTNLEHLMKTANDISDKAVKQLY